MEHGLAFKEFFDGLAGEFGSHIEHSIPGYATNRERTAYAINQLYRGMGLILDVGASEGQFGNELSRLSRYNYTVNIDPNPNMRAAWKPIDPNSEAYFTAAFLDGFHDGEDYIPAYNPRFRFGTVHMSMVRQFVTADAKRWYSEAARLLVPGGLFIVNVKTIASPGDEAGWQAREAAKDAYKLNFFTSEQIATKAEQTLTGMHQLMLTDEQEREALSANFRHVATYWESYNFRGYVASDSWDTLQEFLKHY